jgi:hypothetical protein
MLTMLWSKPVSFTCTPTWQLVPHYLVLLYFCATGKYIPTRDITHLVRIPCPPTHDPSFRLL